MNTLLHLLLFIFWVIYTTLYLAGVWQVDKWMVALMMANFAINHLAKFISEIIK